MAIASGASDGVRCDSAAKESAGAAATLGSQTAAAANEVIVPDAIGSNNEGNLMASPTYAGRMICIRPWEMKLAEIPTIQAGGITYAVSDTIDLAGVAGTTGTAVLTVEAVSAGVITEVSISEADGVQIRRDGMTSAPSPADNPVAQVATSGSGTGATFNCVWEPHFELRFITAGTTTLTVHEDWIVPPVSGDEWAVSYILEDYATLTGCTLRAQSGVFEFSRRCKIGPQTDTARRGWLALNDGKAMELDNLGATINAFEIADGGIFTVGYEQAGKSVNGGYISTSGTLGPNFALNAHIGAMFLMHDIQIRSPRENLSWAVAGVTPFDADEAKFRKESGTIVQFGKLFDVNTGFFTAGHRLRKLTIQKGSSSTEFGMIVSLDADGNSLANINEVVCIGFTDGANLGGFHSIRLVFTALVTFNFLRNITFLSGTRLVEVEENETWQFVNPVWDPDLTDQVNFDFNSVTGSSIEELMSLIIRTVDTSGAAISDVRSYIFEGSLNDDLPAENTNQSISAAYDPIADSRFEDDIDTGDVVYFCDVLSTVYTPNTTVDVSTEARGTFAWRGYKYGNLPQTVPITIDLNGGLDLQVTFLPDDAITQPNKSTAITALSPQPVLIRHSPTGPIANRSPVDLLPMKAMNYDAGTGGVAPTIGEGITGAGSPAPIGEVVDVDGDDVSGTVLLKYWNGVEFTDGINITGDTSAFDATTDVTGFYEEYTWEIDAQGHSSTALYDYLSSRLEIGIILPWSAAIAWGGDEPDANLLMFSGAGGFFTPRAVRRWVGRVDPAATRDFTDDFTRSPVSESPRANLGGVGDWDTRSADPLTIGDGFVQGPNTASQFEDLDTVATSAYDFADDQYAEAELTEIVDISGSAIGVTVRFDAVTERCYAGVDSGDDSLSPEGKWQIALVDVSGLGSTTVLATGTSTPAVGDVMRLVATDNLLILFVNDVEEVRVTDSLLTSGQPGVHALCADPRGKIDNFGAGDFVPGVIIGEGVWIHDRGAGNYDFFTSDGGTVFNVPATITTTLTGLQPGSEVRVCDSTTNAALAGIESTGSPSEFAFSLPSGTTVDIIIHHVQYEHIRIKDFAITADSTIPISQRFDRNYENP